MELTLIVGENQRRQSLRIADIQDSTLESTTCSASVSLARRRTGPTDLSGGASGGLACLLFAPKRSPPASAGAHLPRAIGRRPKTSRRPDWQNLCQPAAPAPTTQRSLRRTQPDRSAAPLASEWMRPSSHFSLPGLNTNVSIPQIDGGPPLATTLMLISCKKRSLERRRPGSRNALVTSQTDAARFRVGPSPAR